MNTWPEPTACCPFGDCDTCNTPGTARQDPARGRRFVDRDQWPINNRLSPEHTALAGIAQAAHKLSQAICDWLDLKENQ